MDSLSHRICPKISAERKNTRLVQEARLDMLGVAQEAVALEGRQNTCASPMLQFCYSA